jgi:hypothetical protein
MRMFLLGLLVPGFCLLAADEPKDVQPEEIIKKFAAKEAEFAKARENYTYKQSVKIQELSPSGAPEGKYEIYSDIIFSPEGKRTEKVTRAPVSTLHLQLDPGDEQDLRNVQPFVLTTTQIPEYDIHYLGKQKVDDIMCYQIVKTYGKGVGLLKKGADNQYPRFETYREQIDGKYWFPTYTRADDTLHFKDMNQRIRMTVKYEDYKQFKGSATVTFGEEVKEPPKK